MSEPLSLTSPRWAELKHVYGPGSDIPDLLRLIADEEPITVSSDIYDQLCSALYHQSDPDTAGYAAIPHLVRIASAKTGESKRRLLYLCGWIEAARVQDSPAMPPDLAAAYDDAMRAGLAAMSAEVGEAPDDELRFVFSAIAAFRGARALAENLMALDQLVDIATSREGDWPWPV